MTYTIAAGESFNMVLSHVDHSDPATWVNKLFKEEVKNEYDGWDPRYGNLPPLSAVMANHGVLRLTKIISLIDKCLKWPLKVSRPLKTWTSPSSRLIVVGDAAHAMLPYMSQGAGMAVEDGAALAVVLSKITSLDQMPFALQVFEKERMKRSGDMQNASTVNGYIWHFPDGPIQVARDSAMAAELSGLPFTSSANQWSDPVTQWWAYGYDAESAMEAAWKKAVGELIIHAAR
jgi:salicylate hydroxylase